MTKATQQIQAWRGEFGKKYVARNSYTPRQLDQVYRRVFGVTCTQLNQDFLGKLNRNIRILEVGSNVGNQLLLLQKMGFRELYGIEINEYAVEAARKRLKQIHIIPGSAFDIPFKDGYFDLVFTAGVLIHIHPRDLAKAMREMIRCTRKYIWGYESYAEACEQVLYRGKKGLYWKTDFAKEFQKVGADLKSVKTQFIPYLDSEHVDYMYLLKKG